MSSPPKTIEQKTVQDNAPWKEAQPYFADLYKRANEAMEATNKNPFMGDFLAGPTATQMQGLDLAKTAALNPSATVAAPMDNSAIRDYATKSLSGAFLPSASFNYQANPFLSGAIEAGIAPVRRSLMEVALPGIADQAIAQGAYGGAGQDISQERAVRQFGETAGNIASNISMGDYNNQMGLWASQLEAERGRQQGATGILGGVNASDWASQNAFLQDQARMKMSPGQDLITLGGLEQGWNQTGLENILQKDQAQRTAPWYGLGELANILTQGGFKTMTGTSTQPNPNYVDPFTNMLKIALGGASTVAGLGGAGGFGLWGKKAA